MQRRHMCSNCRVPFPFTYPLFVTRTHAPLTGCYPFVDDDPFVIQNCPHVVFAGNQPQYATSVIEGVCRCALEWRFLSALCAYS